MSENPCNGRSRWALPARRRSETFEVDFGGYSKTHTVTVGFYGDGDPGEVFISGGKSGELVEAIARDGAILLSMVLQHRVPLTVVQRAVTRDGQGVPQSIVGAVIDRLVELAKEEGKTQATETQATETQATETQATETQVTETQVIPPESVETQAAKTHTAS
jgi:hypothetical protein